MQVDGCFIEHILDAIALALANVRALISPWTVNTTKFHTPDTLHLYIHHFNDTFLMYVH